MSKSSSKSINENFCGSRLIGTASGPSHLFRTALNASSPDDSTRPNRTDTSCREFIDLMPSNEDFRVRVSGIIVLSTASNVRCRAETANPPGAPHSTVMATFLIHLIKKQ